MDWLDYIGVIVGAFAAGFVTRWVIERATRRADEGKAPDGQAITHAALDVIAKGVLETVTLLRQQKEDVMTGQAKIVEAVTRILAAQQDHIAKDKAVLAMLTHVKAELASVRTQLAQIPGVPADVETQMDGLAADLDAGTALLQGESAKEDAALQTAPATTEPPVQTGETVSVPSDGTVVSQTLTEETVDTAPAIEPAPAPAEAPAESAPAAEPTPEAPAQ